MAFHELSTWQSAFIGYRGWNDSAVWAVYLQGLNRELVKEFACREKASSLDRLINLSIKQDNILREAESKLKVTSNPPLTPQSFTRTPLFLNSSSEPMEMNTNKISFRERQSRRQEKLCSYCGSEKHQSLSALNADIATKIVFRWALLTILYF